MKKGITPVIAIILLLLITISMIGFTFVFFQRTVTTSAQAGEQQLEQQIAQTGTQFAIENVDKNRVTIRNLGTAPLTGLSFYVNDVPVDSNNATIPPNSVGTVILHDGQLAQLPDPARLRAVASGFSDAITANFYGKYTAAYWKMDETGNTIKDSSENGNDATAIVSNPALTAGRYGNALSFDGTNYASINPSATLNNLPVLTAQAWVNPSSSTGFRDTLGKPAYANGGFMLRTSQGGSGGLTPHVYTTPPVAGQWHTCSAPTLPLGQWTHITMTYDGETLRGYTNGALTCQNAAMSGTLPALSATMYMARGEPGTNFQGALDEMRILKVARTMTIS